MEAHVKETAEVDRTLESKDSSTQKCCDESCELSEACSKGLTDLAMDLLGRGADVNICRTLNGTDVRALDKKCFKTLNATMLNCPLYQAVRYDHCDVVELLAKNGAKYVEVCPVSFQGQHYVTRLNGTPTDVFTESETTKGSLLQLAVIHCSSIAVRFLVDTYQTDISFLDMFDSLVDAVRFGKREAARAIVEGYQLEPDDENVAKVIVPQKLFLLICRTIRQSSPKDETLPLLFLEKYGKLLTKESLKEGTCERIPNLLYIAVSQTLVVTVEKLIELIISYMDHAQFKKRQELDGYDVGSNALSHGNLPILQKLVAAGLLDVGQHPNALFESIHCSRHGADVGEVISWLVSEWGLNPTATNADGLEPIHFAIKTSDAACVAALALHGADVNAANSVDWLTPAHMHLNFCLVQLGVDPSVQLLDMLISHGADLSAINRPGYTPLSVLFWLLQRTQMRRRAAISRQFYIVDFSDMTRFPLNAFFAPVQMDEFLTTFSEDINVNYVFEGEDVTLPYFFQAGQPMRHFIERLASKFGLGLLSMGSDRLYGPLHWDVMEKILHRAAIPWQHVPSLQTCCWSAIRSSVGGVNFQRKVGQLPLPDKLKVFLHTL